MGGLVLDNLKFLNNFFAHSRFCTILKTEYSVCLVKSFNKPAKILVSMLELNEENIRILHELMTHLHTILSISRLSIVQSKLQKSHTLLYVPLLQLQLGELVSG